MKKTKLMSFICVMMVLCMMFPIVLASCDSGESIYDLPMNRKPVALTMLTIVDDSTTPEAVSAVEKALNEITEAKYTTKIKLIACKKSDYNAELQRRFEAYDAEQAKIKEELSIANSLEKISKDQARKDRAAGIPTIRTERPTQPPKTTELYTERILWPEIKPDQIDIFLIISTDMFVELADAGRLSAMDDELSTKAKILSSYIHPSIMIGGVYKEKTLAIPTNKALGTSTYVAVNKRLAEAYNSRSEEIPEYVTAGEYVRDELDLSTVKEYEHLEKYMEWVKANAPEVALIEGPFVPLKNYESVFADIPDLPIISEIKNKLVYVPEHEATARPTLYAPITTEAPTDENGEVITTIPGTTNKPKINSAVTDVVPDKPSLYTKFNQPWYQNIIKTNIRFREKGLFENSPIPEGKERAAFIMQGTLADKGQWEAADSAQGFDYEYILYGNPVATKEEIQSAMYAISVSSKVPVARCMEIITLMNTDKTFKNTFQYGVAGTHYIYNDNGRIERISDDYMINMDYTGNHFIADLMEGDHPNKWQLAQDHNLNLVNSSFINTYIYVDKLLTPEHLEQLPNILELSVRYNDDLINGRIPEGYLSVEDFISEHVNVELRAAGLSGTSSIMEDIRTVTNPELYE